MTNTTNTWKIDYGVPDIPKSLLDAGYAPLLASVLTVRGIFDPEQAEEKFFCSAKSIGDPFRILRMDEAVARVRKAITAGEKVAVYGDYDVDGITSTALLTDYLSFKGLEVLPYIPDRTEEGYGLNCMALEQFAGRGITLVITVDCGITAMEEARYARTLGIDMIITDHHECREGEIPEAAAVLDCKQPGDTYPNVGLAGVGMTFKLVCACEGNTEEILDRYADLVAIGTVADVMPLIGENRYIVIRGLTKMRSAPRTGLAAIMKEARINPAALSAASIGYSIAPRLNAAGRISRALDAKDLLLCTDPEKAALLAADLCEINRKRQDIEDTIWKEAGKLVDPLETDGPIVLASSEWHQGVIGIAASRLAEHFGRPTVMINLTGEFGKGSCRSFGGFNLFEALSACSEHLISFGGHALAAGLNIEAGRIDDFREALKNYYILHKPQPQPEIVCDLLITDIALLDAENIFSLSTLEPFGNRNPKPILCLMNVIIEKIHNSGSEKRIRFIVNAGGIHFNCVYFGHCLKEFPFKVNDTVDIAFTPQISKYLGALSTQLQISGIRNHDPVLLCRNILEEGCSFRKAAAPYLPDRQAFIRAWRAVCSVECLGNTMEELLALCPPGMEKEKFCICLEVFRQAGLLSGGTVYGARKVQRGEKANLEETPLMRRLRSGLL